MLQKIQPDRVHQPMPCLVRSKDPDKAGSGPYCRYNKCPGLKSKAKTKRSYKTIIYQCEQCTVEKGFNLWLCHTTEKVKGVQTVCLMCILLCITSSFYWFGTSGRNRTQNDIMHK